MHGLYTKQSMTVAPATFALHFPPPPFPRERGDTPPVNRQGGICRTPFLVTLPGTIPSRGCCPPK